MCNALRTAQALVRKAQDKNGLRCVEILPGPLFRYASNSAWVRLFIELFTTTYFHACGTCAMSPDKTVDPEIGSESTIGPTLKGGVVDSDLRVRGVTGLRIVDASVIPAIPSGPIAAVCMAMAEIASQKILNTG